MKKIKKSGFSLPELIIAMGLTTIVIGVSVYTLDMIKNKASKKSDEIVYLMEKLGSEKVIQRDLSLLVHSFNNVIQKDDKDRSFFDYRRDPFCNIKTEDCERKITLKINQGETKSKSFYMLVINNRLGIRYQISYERAFPMVDGVFDLGNYSGLNNPSSTDYPSLKNSQTDNPNSPWLKGEYLVLFTANTYSSEPLNKMVIPRPYFIFGQVADDEVDLEWRNPLNDENIEIISKKNPKNDNAYITSASDLLTSLEITPGKSFALFIEGCQIIKYHIERDDSTSSKYFLVRTIGQYDKGKSMMTFSSKQIRLSDSTYEITFSRNNISSPAITFETKNAEKTRWNNEKKIYEN